MQDLMVDLETLGTTADAVILSIGAVMFDLTTGEIDENGFYASISVESNLDRGRKVKEDTLLWWLKQPAAAQQVFFENKLSLDAALVEFSDWLGDSKWRVWAKGPSFDISMLEHAYKSLGMDPPWDFWNTRCVRTYMDLPGAKGISAPVEGVKHNALSDAYQQAQTVQMIHSKLFGSEAKPKAKARSK